MYAADLTRKLNVPYRTVRYVLERGHAAHWIPAEPGSGHHRNLSDGQAFALAMLVTLKQAGLRMPEAEAVTRLVEEGLRTLARGLGWDPGFQPFRGELQTARTWLAEIGDAAAFRLQTDAHPSRAGVLKALPWTTWHRPRQELKGYRPCITVCINLSRLAALVAGGGS